MKRNIDCKESRCRIAMYAVLTVSFIFIAYQYAVYIDIAKSTVPIMDYWKWITVYGQKLLDGEITFADYFRSDAGEHIQPICMAINFWVLRAFDFDVRPLVEWGLYGRIAVAAAVTGLFIFRFRNSEQHHYILQFLCALAIIMAVFNYNQWEMTTEPFSLTNVFRISNYFLSFYLTDLFLKEIESRSTKRNLVLAVLLGVYCAYLTIFVGAAYFVGHLVAIGLAMLWTLMNQRENVKKYLWPMAVWGVISFLSACVYYILICNRGVARETIESTNNILILLLEGICFFWGGLFIHTQTMEQYGGALVTMLGALVLVYSLFILSSYLRKRRDGKELLPAICVLYALVLSVAISLGRVTVFGAASMSSSRYVVESTMGLSGVIWMSYSVFLDSPKTKISWAKPAACACTVILLLGAAEKTENGIAPYRAIYNDNLYEMMTHIENYSDEELAPFQANSASDVRYCVAFFEENGLSIFSDRYSR